MIGVLSHKISCTVSLNTSWNLTISGLDGLFTSTKVVVVSNWFSLYIKNNIINNYVYIIS